MKGNNKGWTGIKLALCTDVIQNESHWPCMKWGIDKGQSGIELALYIVTCIS